MIINRSGELMTFVNQYGNTRKEYQVNHALLTLTDSLGTITQLFEHPINFELDCDNIYADPILLKLVTIDLVKNASEASDDEQPILINDY